MFTTGTTVEILTGKFKGQKGTVSGSNTDKGTFRFRVQLASGAIFSYLPTSLSNGLDNGSASFASAPASLAANAR